MILRRATYEEAKEIKLWDEFIGDRRLDNWRGELIVAALEDEIIGYVNYSSNLFYNRPFISLLCVKASHRRRGAAQQLVKRVLEIYQGLDVWASTEEWNDPAIRLFAKMGFQKMGAIRALNRDDAVEVFYLHNGRKEPGAMSAALGRHAHLSCLEKPQRTVRTRKETPKRRNRK